MRTSSTAPRVDKRVAVTRDVAVENRSGPRDDRTPSGGGSPQLTWTAARGSTPITGWRARPHDSQRYHRLLGLRPFPQRNRKVPTLLVTEPVGWLA